MWFPLPDGEPLLQSPGELLPLRRAADRGGLCATAAEAAEGVRIGASRTRIGVSRRRARHP